MSESLSSILISCFEEQQNLLKEQVKKLKAFQVNEKKEIKAALVDQKIRKKKAPVDPNKPKYSFGYQFPHYLDYLFSFTAN